ncbi:MAG: hypothetical protein ABJA79_00740 [Parafilimonas sp.]
MNDTKTTTEDLGRNVADYVETFYQLSVVKLVQKSTTIVAFAVTMFFICLVSMFVIFFSAFATAIWLGTLVNSKIAGYLIVAAFFLLILIVIILFRKRILFPFIRNLMVRKIYE